jgi:type I restriction enzyme M protein
MPSTNEIVAKLWNLCHVLRDDGVTYHQYVTELTYLLFLKMAQETGSEKSLPKSYRWADLVAKDGTEQLTFYRSLLLHLGPEASSARVRDIYANANTTLRQPAILQKLVKEIDALDWYSAKHEGLGDLYEGLLEKNANEKKSGAGQYFTPRPLIDSMVHVTKPQPGEYVQDPAAGTGGFLIAADRYIKAQTNDLFDLSTAQQEFQKKKAFYGMELVHDTHRLLLMNAMLHDVEGPLMLGDTLSDSGKKLAPADVILTNPPFGTKKGGGLPSRDDFTYPTSNKQLAFLQHVYRGLRPSTKTKISRAAVVVPDNVLFEENTGAEIRADLMDKCNLHTVLRLPTGIFYAQGVKTNVLFFTKGEGAKDTGNTKEVWIYDLRANMPSFGKTTPLTRAHFADFETAYGEDPYGRSKRVDQGDRGRFRKFTREEIGRRGENLDISWLRDESGAVDEHAHEPSLILAAVRQQLAAALAEIDALSNLLEAESA